MLTVLWVPLKVRLSALLVEKYLGRLGIIMFYVADLAVGLTVTRNPTVLFYPSLVRPNSSPVRLALRLPPGRGISRRFGPIGRLKARPSL